MRRCTGSWTGRERGAIDVFGNISRSSAKAIATMDRRNGICPPRYFTSSCANALSHTAAMCQLISKTITPRGRGRRFELCFMYKGTKYRALDLKLRIDSARAFISLADGRDRPLLQVVQPVKIAGAGTRRAKYFTRIAAASAKRYRDGEPRARHMPRADATKEVVDIRGGSRETGTWLSRLD